MTRMCPLEKSPSRPLCLRSPCRMWWRPQGQTCCSSVSSLPIPHPKVSSRAGARLRLRQREEEVPLPQSSEGGVGEEGQLLHGAGLTPVYVVGELSQMPWERGGQAWASVNEAGIPQVSLGWEAKWFGLCVG